MIERKRKTILGGKSENRGEKSTSNDNKRIEGKKKKKVIVNVVGANTGSSKDPSTGIDEVLG